MEIPENLRSQAGNACCSRKMLVGKLLHSNTSTFQDVTMTLTLRNPLLEPDFPKNEQVENISLTKTIRDIPEISFSSKK